MLRPCGEPQGTVAGLHYCAQGVVAGLHYRACGAVAGLQHCAWVGDDACDGTGGNGER